ncbi:MAG: zinc metalloprotease HtpX [Chloroflexota bacterium]|jgi:heat shock protein HtpX
MNSGNTLKTVFLLTLLTGLFILVGQAIGGQGGMLIAFIFAMGMNFVSYWFSDKIALQMAGAKEVAYEDAPDLHRLVEQLASYARMPKPRVYIIESPSPNAFATGRDPNHAAVAVTTGILRILNSNELAGVLAHELAHIKNRDTLIATVVAAIAGAITMLANMAQWALIFGGGRGDDEGEGVGSLAGSLLMIILAPIAATIIQLAISRAREYDADATGARVLGDPNALANALEKLEMGTRYAPMQVNQAAAHLFIVNPFAGGLSGLFSTHPPIAERVERLRRMAMQPTAYGIGF